MGFSEKIKSFCLVYAYPKSTRFNRRLFVTTATLENAIAAPAKAGERVHQKRG